MNVLILFNRSNTKMIFTQLIFQRNVNIDLNCIFKTISNIYILIFYNRIFIY